MPGLARHVPHDTTIRQCSIYRLLLRGNGRLHSPAGSVSSRLSRATPNQLVVDVDTGCTAEEWLWLEAPAAPEGAYAEQQGAVTAQKVNKSSREQLRIVSSVAQDNPPEGLQLLDEQQTGLHVLRQYVPSPNELLQRQQQQVQGSHHNHEPEQASDVNQQKEFQKSLVRQLMACNSIQQLSDIVQQHGPSMDFMSITTCFTTAAQLVTQRRQAHQLVQQATQQPAAADTFEGLCQTSEQQSSMRQSACVPQEAAAGPQELPGHNIQTPDEAGSGSIVDSQQQTGTANTAVDSSFQLEQLQEILHQQLIPSLQARLQRADATGLVLILYSLAVLRVKKDQRLLLDLEHAVTPLISQLSPRLLSQLMWSLCSLDIQPQQLLLMRLQLQSGRRMQDANAQDCAQLIQGFARLQQVPGQQWMDLFYSRVSQLLHLGELPPQSLSMVVYSLGKLQLQPPAPLLLSLQAAAGAALSQLPPAGLIMLTDGLHMLRVKQPSMTWQVSYLQAVQAKLQDCTARELPVFAVVLLRWKCVPPADWMQQYLEACEQQMWTMTAQGLAVLGHSLSGLKVLPPNPWLQQFLTASKQQQLASTPAGCSYLLSTIGAWNKLLQAQARPAEAAIAGDVQPVGRSARIGSSKVARGHVDQDTTAAPGVPQAVGDCPTDSSDNSRNVMQLMQGPTATCVDCFVEHGGSFTAEQLGMFCKGLAMLGLQGSQQLSKQLQQVVLELLVDPRKQRRRLAQQYQQQQHPQQRQRPTSATLVNILLALAVSCHTAATPKVMTCVWSALHRQLHTVTPSQAAAVAWASAKLSNKQSQRSLQGSSTATARGSTAYQPPRGLAEGLFEQLMQEVDSATLKDVTVLLLGSRAAGWELEKGRVQLLVREMLRKQLVQQQQGQQWQAEEPSATAGVANSTEQGSFAQHVREQQQLGQPQQAEGTVTAATADRAGSTDIAKQQQQQPGQWHHNSTAAAASGSQRHQQQSIVGLSADSSSSSSSDGSGRCSSAASRCSNSLGPDSSLSSSGSSTAAPARVFGLANHRLKDHLAATAAAAAWAHVLGPKARTSALLLCQQYLAECSWLKFADAARDIAAAQQQQLAVEQQSWVGKFAVDLCCLASAQSSCVPRNTAPEVLIPSKLQRPSVQVPEHLAAWLWEQRVLFWDQLSLKQQRLFVRCWQDAGFAANDSDDD